MLSGLYSACDWLRSITSFTSSASGVPATLPQHSVEVARMHLVARRQRDAEPVQEIAQ